MKSLHGTVTPLQGAERELNQELGVGMSANAVVHARGKN